MIAGTFKEVIFADRKVLVTFWYGRGLGVIDPTRQAGLERGRVRTWIAHKNSEFILYFSHPPKPEPPKSNFQIALAIRGYASFLDSRIPRPPELDLTPVGYVYRPGEEPREPYVEPIDPGDNCGWTSWIEQGQPLNLYDDHDGEFDPARPRAPIVNYTGRSPDDEEDSGDA